MIPLASRNRRIRAPSNIRTTAGYADYEGYRSYPTYAAGIEDWYQLIRSLYVDGWGLRTVSTIVPRYAPAADHNDPASYIADVQTLVAGWRARAWSPCCCSRWCGAAI